jgi:sphingomyelin phosphodiesterase
MDSGLLIASKYPIVANDSIVYTDACSVDAFAAKGAIYAKIQVSPHGFLHVFATHLQASYATVTTVDFGVRVRQSTALRGFILSKVNNDEWPVFLLGDMNINSTGEKEEYRKLITTLSIPGYELIDLLREHEHPSTSVRWPMGLVGSNVSVGQGNDWNGAKSIDYVFVYRKNGKELKCEAQLEPFTIEGKPYRHLSDHLGVRCDVMLN